jgi:hypothetical protein
VDGLLFQDIFKAADELLGQFGNRIEESADEALKGLFPRGPGMDVDGNGGRRNANPSNGWKKFLGLDKHGGEKENNKSGTEQRRAGEVRRITINASSRSSRRSQTLATWMLEKRPCKALVLKSLWHFLDTGYLGSREGIFGIGMMVCIYCAKDVMKDRTMHGLECWWHMLCTKTQQFCKMAPLRVRQGCSLCSLFKQGKEHVMFSYHV